MPRRSVESLSVVAIPNTTRLQPPSNLSKTEAELFRSIINATSPKHFARSDTPLLARYVKNLALADLASGYLEREGAVNPETGKVNVWLAVSEKADKAVVALATKLRLCPSTRFDQATAHRFVNTRRPSYYEQMNDDNA